MRENISFGEEKWSLREGGREKTKHIKSQDRENYHHNHPHAGSSSSLRSAIEERRKRLRKREGRFKPREAPFRREKQHKRE